MGELRLRCGFLVISLLSCLEINCYEKTLRKIVRNQSKMVQRPFSELESGRVIWRNSTIHHAVKDNELIFPRSAQMRTLFYKTQPPVISTMISSELHKRKTTYSKVNVAKIENSPNERPAMNTFFFSNSSNTDVIPVQPTDYTIRPLEVNAIKNETKIKVGNDRQVPTASIFFPPIEDQGQQSAEQKSYKENIIIPNNLDVSKEKDIEIKSIMIPVASTTIKSIDPPNYGQNSLPMDIDPESEKADFFIEGVSLPSSFYKYNISTGSYSCNVLKETDADIDAQDKFSKFDIEPTWAPKKHFWNSIFDSRYEALMRSPKWPPLKVILVPRTHVDTIWKRPFEKYHNDTVNKIISNIIKKLQYYSNLTFSWNEVSHLSQWWKTTRAKSRTALRKLLKSGRLEITTGGWVETDEATTHLFGLVHQLIEGHQWLKYNLNYYPKVAWLTNSVTHSPTMAYLLSASDVQQLILTNLHFSWEEYLAEFQYSDFIWIQNWDNNKAVTSTINDALKKIGHERYPKHATLTHYLQFNSAGFKACGPNWAICTTDFNFAKSDRNLDINAYNIKQKAEMLLEQYSKTGTISSHNIVIAPLGGPYSYEIQPEFDFQYNNYEKLAEFININKNIYKATVEFGTPKDYFSSILEQQRDYPTLKGDFLNFADLVSGQPAYWTGFYTSRPVTKILLRRLQSTLRTTEILFSFAVSLNAFRRYNMTDIFEMLIKARETVSRLLDRNVVSGTVSAYTLKFVHNQIMSTVKDCWHIQEIAASLMSIKPGLNNSYLEKYVYRDGEFMSVFRTVSPGDQVYVFNSLSHERTEVVKLVTRNPNVRIIDHNKKDVTIQINPVWKYNLDNTIKISRSFFEINFAIVLPPMTLELFKIKEIYDGSQNTATIYCSSCILDDSTNDGLIFPFTIQPLQSGDIQLENYKHRLVFDEVTGFLKTVIDKETDKEKTLSLDYGAFRGNNVNSGMYLFNTNTTRPLEDILKPYRSGAKTKVTMIVSGLLVTQMTSLFGMLLQHSVKIFNLVQSPWCSSIYVESKIDYEISPKYRDLELFLTIQTDIGNGNNPRIFTDNNGFQLTSRILNMSRRIESNVYPITSMAFIEDKYSRLTLITDHAQGVTALQEGQLAILLDRRVLYNDGRGPNEGLADSSAHTQRHYILLENLTKPSSTTKHSLKADLVLPSVSAVYLAHALEFLVEIFIVGHKQSELAYYAFLPLIKTSFPCDVTVLNYRVVITKDAHNYSTNIALLVLHRHGFSCQINTTPRHCNGDNDFVIDKILRNINAVYQTNLPGTNQGLPLFHFNHDNFPPMELTTLRIHF